MYCAQCYTVMASQDASWWWCTEVCFEEWQTQRWSACGASVRALAPQAVKPR